MVNLTDFAPHRARRRDRHPRAGPLLTDDAGRTRGLMKAMAVGLLRPHLDRNGSG
jgi:hypothetical protein